MTSYTSDIDILIKIFNAFERFCARVPSFKVWWSSDSAGSRPGHKVSVTRSKFPNLNENRQKSHFSLGFWTQNPVKILSRSATVRPKKGEISPT